MNHFRTCHRQSGSIILYVVAAIAVLGVISLATTGMFSSSTVGTARVNCPAAAQYLAESGIRYAQAQLRAQTDLTGLTNTATTLNNTTYTVSDGGTFDLTVPAPTDNGSVYEVTNISCTGTACTNDPSPSTHTLTMATVTTTIASTAGGGGGDPDEISFKDGDIGDFEDAGEENEDFVQKDEDAGTIAVGNNEGASFGCSWYTGDDGPCENGICDFGSGFRVYYEFMLSHNADGDGYVFTIMNGDNNTVDACGGDTSRGELLGYAGKGSSGSGIKAPKLGLEFDIYTNSGTNSNFCNVGQRADDSDSRDHAAWIFWGGDSSGSGGCDATYDDNRHGAGDGDSDEPRNPENISGSGEGSDGYYYDESNGDNWLRGYNSGNSGNEFRVRIEVDRDETANDDGNYCYTLKGWIMRDNTAMPDGFNSTEEDFYDASDESTWPDVEHAIVLSPTEHANFNDIIFGWTAGTGGATEIVTFSDFALRFNEDPETCETDTIPPKLEGYWPFYEGEGTTAHDISKNHNHGTITNEYWMAGVGCPDCGAIYVDGDGDGSVSIPAHGSQDQRNDGSLAAWVYLNAYSPLGAIIRKGHNSSATPYAYFLGMGHAATHWGNRTRLSTSSYNFSFAPSGGGGWGGGWGGGSRYTIYYAYLRPLFCFQDSGSKHDCLIDMTSTMEYDKWYHIAVAWHRSDKMTMYVNGVEVDSMDESDWDGFRPINSSGRLTIGTMLSNDRDAYPFDGMIDDAMLFDHALSADEVLDLYNNGRHAP